MKLPPDRRLQFIAEVLDAATPNPWSYTTTIKRSGMTYEIHEFMTDKLIATATNAEDAALISMAPSFLTDLLEIIFALRGSQS